MTRKDKRAFVGIVVDASVARSAGESGKEEAAFCAKCLSIIWDRSFHLIMTKDIHKEWEKHRSGYSSNWLAKMIGKRRVKNIPPDKSLCIDNKIERSSDFNKRQKKALKKDGLLIEAALASDKRIVSKDKEARELFHKLTSQTPELHNVYWAHVMCSKCLEWLKANAEFGRKWRTLKLDNSLESSGPLG